MSSLSSLSSLNPLDGCEIIVAAPHGEPSAAARVETLRSAGATVRACTLSQDLWAALSERAFDLIIVQAEQNDFASAALYDQLRKDPRTRGTPVLRSAQLMYDDFLSSSVNLANPMRRLREAAQRERELREQLQVEIGRANESAHALADLSHELRSMLSAIMGFGCNLRDEIPGPLEPDQKTHVAGILDAVNRATRLLKSNASRSIPMSRPLNLTPPSAPPRAQRSFVQLATVATEVVALFEATAVRKSQQLRCVCDETVGIWGESLKLKQVVTNLVVNALKYTPAGGSVNVRVQWSNPNGADGVDARRMAQVVVSDTGPGIPREHREQIFRRGYRMDVHAQVEGDGIGLAVVRELVAQHGGAVMIEDTKGTGAVFKVSLPQDRRQRARTPETGTL